MKITLNRTTLWGGTAALVVVVVGGVVLANHASKNSMATVDKTHYTVKEACDVLTPPVAKKIVGVDAVSKPLHDSKSEDSTISNCDYTGSSGSAGLLVRSPLNKQSATTNKDEFGSQKPPGTLAVYGYGEAAFWDPRFHQLNILKQNTWYIFSAGPAKPAARTLDQTKTFAKLFLSQL